MKKDGTTQGFNRKQLFTVLIWVNLFTCITLLIFGPYEIYISNRNNFRFTFREFFWIPLAVGGVYFAFVTILGMLLPTKFVWFCVKLEFALTLCCYIQAMVLNGDVEALIGQEVSWGFGITIPNLLVWILIIVAIFVLAWKYKEYTIFGIKFSSFAITTMQLVALVSLLLTTDVLADKGNSKGYPSADEMLKVSADDNVIVFLLDFFDGRTMDAVLEAYPDILDDLEGFTYYPNATSVYSRTYPSVTYLLTGEMCYFDKEYRTYVENAHENGRLLPELYKNNIDIALYTDEQYIGTCATGYLSNWRYEKTEMRKLTLEKYLLRMILYRDMPYMLKPFFEYDTDAINSNVKKGSVLDNRLYDNLNDDGVKAEFEKGLYVDENMKKDGVFRFFHLSSAHLNLSAPVEPAAYSWGIVNDYINQMKQLGIYEEATILIISDHGYSGGGTTLDMPHKTAVPIFFVKPSGSSEDEMKISQAPVSHTDFIPTVLDGFDLDYSELGRTVYEIGEEEERIRTYYYSALYSDKIGEEELREYSVIGDARKESDYIFTGNVWDILYSENKVAQ